MTTYQDNIRMELVDLENKSLRDVAAIVYDLRFKVKQQQAEITSLERSRAYCLQYVPTGKNISGNILHINLNTKVEVHLTDKGLEVLNNYYKVAPDALKDNFMYTHIFTSTLWRIMHIFGSFIDGTNREAYFTDNQITLKFD